MVTPTQVTVQGLNVPDKDGVHSSAFYGQVTRSDTVNFSDGTNSHVARGIWAAEDTWAALVRADGVVVNVPLKVGLNPFICQRVNSTPATGVGQSEVTADNAKALWFLL